MDSAVDVARAYLLDEVIQGSVELHGYTNLIEEEILDSLGIFELVSFLEERFDLEIDEEELTFENFESLDAIGRLLDEKLAARRS